MRAVSGFGWMCVDSFSVRSFVEWGIIADR